MLLNLLNPSNYVNYNITVAKLFGLHTAIYLSELLSINQKAINKEKMQDNVFFVDRKYIESRTTLNKSEQMRIETNLKKIGVIDKPKDVKDGIILNVMVLATLLESEDENLKKEITDISSRLTNNRMQKKAKEEAIKANVKKSITATNEELIEAYSKWIDAVYEKLKFMTKETVISAQEQVDKVANHNLDVALDIISIATNNGYREMKWAINQYYEMQHLDAKIIPHTNNAKITKDTELSKEVF